VQNTTTMIEFIHSEGMETTPRSNETSVLLDGAKRPCSALYRPPLECNREKKFSRLASFATGNLKLCRIVSPAEKLARQHRRSRYNRSRIVQSR
jgi:hypothetical protein